MSVFKMSKMSFSWTSGILIKSPFFTINIYDTYHVYVHDEVYVRLLSTKKNVKELNLILNDMFHIQCWYF